MDGKNLTNVTLQLWFSVECAACCSLYSRLYNEPGLAPLIPCCPSACVREHCAHTKTLIHTHTHSRTKAHTHTCIHPRSEPTSAEEVSARGDGFLKGGKEQWFANEAWWTATLILLVLTAPHFSNSLSPCFTPFPFPLSLNTFGLIVCCCWLKLSQASQHCCCLEKEHWSVSLLLHCLICTDRRRKTQTLH